MSRRGRQVIAGLEATGVHALLRRALRWKGVVVLCHHRIGAAAGTLGDPALYSATPDETGRALLSRAAEAGGITARGWTRVLRLARTIADLEGVDGVRRLHVAEALSYRRQLPDAEAGVAAGRLSLAR